MAQSEKERTGIHEIKGNAAPLGKIETPRSERVAGKSQARVFPVGTGTQKSRKTRHYKEATGARNALSMYDG